MDHTIFYQLAVLHTFVEWAVLPLLLTSEHHHTSSAGTHFPSHWGLEAQLASVAHYLPMIQLDANSFGLSVAPFPLKYFIFGLSVWNNCNVYNGVTGRQWKSTLSRGRRKITHVMSSTTSVRCCFRRAFPTLQLNSCSSSMELLSLTGWWVQMTSRNAMWPALQQHLLMVSLLWHSAGIFSVVLYRVSDEVLASVLWCCKLGGRKGIWPVKRLSGGMLAWLSGMGCRLAYSPADATATHYLLLQ